MPYRTPGQTISYHIVQPKLSLKQWLRYHLYLADNTEQWYREYLGGVWCKAMPSLFMVSKSPSKAIPGWIRATEGLDKCMHEDLVGWLKVLYESFPDEFGVYADSAVAHEFHRIRGSATCDCEKYHHRLASARVN